MKIGFIGAGQMGVGMIANLVKHRHQVYCFDKNPRNLNQAIIIGAIKTNTLKALADNSKLIILCLPHPKISKEVIFGKTGLIISKIQRKTIIETSTLDPETVLLIANTLKKNFINFLSTPVFGRPNDSLTGNLDFLAEGDKKIFNQYKKILLHMGKSAVYVGKSPLATLTKLSKNLCKFSSMAVGLEIIKLLYQYTNNIKPIYKILTTINSENIWEKSIKKNVFDKTDYQPSNTLIKDLKLVNKIAKNKKVKMTLNQATLNYFSKLISA